MSKVKRFKVVVMTRTAGPVVRHCYAEREKVAANEAFGSVLDAVFVSSISEVDEQGNSIAVNEVNEQ
jgi:hypothetical protein